MIAKRGNETKEDIKLLVTKGREAGQHSSNVRIRKGRVVKLATELSNIRREKSSKLEVMRRKRLAISNPDKDLPKKRGNPSPEGTWFRVRANLRTFLGLTRGFQARYSGDPGQYT